MAAVTGEQRDVQGQHQPSTRYNSQKLPRSHVWCKSQDALALFLYEGISYTSVTKNSPVILERNPHVQHMIRNLNQYRPYSSSLLILYGGEQLTPPLKRTVFPDFVPKRVRLTAAATSVGSSRANMTTPALSEMPRSWGSMQQPQVDGRISSLFPAAHMFLNHLKTTLGDLLMLDIGRNLAPPPQKRRTTGSAENVTRRRRTLILPSTHLQQLRWFFEICCE